MEHTKNAELSLEQNYNHIDGLINNLPIQPPEQEKPLDKVKEPPRPRRSREGEDRLPRSASAMCRSIYGCALTSWTPFRSAWPRLASAT